MFAAEVIFPFFVAALNEDKWKTPDMWELL